MTAASSPQLEPAVILDESPSRIAPVGEIDTRFPGSPQFAPGGNQSDVSDSRISEFAHRAGAQASESCGNRA
jgi:hypothetical protein